MAKKAVNGLHRSGYLARVVFDAVAKQLAISVFQALGNKNTIQNNPSWIRGTFDFSGVDIPGSESDSGKEDD
ncbi:hypothetical protein CPB97_005507 [Podila verticillata]|nr:hypothetical protein CPB97_005507 [Podila verticillata]